MLDKVKFADIMTGLFDMYNKVPSQFIFDVYYKIFEGYDHEKFEGAVQSCLKNRVYNSVPKPAEILEFLEGSKDDKALVAWLQVMEAVRKGGYYASIEFADPIIAHCVNELGGWAWFCCSPKDELPFVEKRFMDLYRLFLKRGIADNVRLIGFIEARNNQMGHIKEIPVPIRIGFKDIEQNIMHRTANAMHLH